MYNLHNNLFQLKQQCSGFDLLVLISFESLDSLQLHLLDCFEVLLTFEKELTGVK